MHPLSVADGDGVVADAELRKLEIGNTGTLAVAAIGGSSAAA